MKWLLATNKVEVFPTHVGVILKCDDDAYGITVFPTYVRVIPYSNQSADYVPSIPHASEGDP